MEGRANCHALDHVPSYHNLIHDHRQQHDPLCEN